MGTPSNVAMGPGTIYVAPIGTTEPANATAALPSAWRAVGYTEAGSTFTFSRTTEDIEVAEEFWPIDNKTTKISGRVAFQMAEATAQNLALALNAGANASASADVEPVDPGSEVAVMIVVDKENGARWLFRKATQAGDVEIANKKAPDKTLIPVEFALQKPTGAQPWKAFRSLTGVTGLV